MVRKLREQTHLDQTGFGKYFHSSAMAVSRWERGVQEPPAHAYIELGNLAGDPDCWYFWGRAGLHSEDIIRVMPQLHRRLRTVSINKASQMVSAGSGSKKKLRSEKESQLVVIPVLQVVAAAGERGDPTPLLQASPTENTIAAPTTWCPNPQQTVCLRVKGHSMRPLIQDGFVLAVDSSQRDMNKLNGKIVIAWNKDRGLTVSRIRQYDHTTVLQPENPEYESVTVSKANKWKILARVLWWIGKAP